MPIPNLERTANRLINEKSQYLLQHAYNPVDWYPWNSKINRIGENIKALREQSGFTQSNIAGFLKVDQSLISKIENNERFITSDILENLSALFGVTADSLLGESVPTNRIVFALRASEINENDLETISAINRIALNLNFVTQLLGGHTNDR